MLRNIIYIKTNFIQLMVQHPDMTTFMSMLSLLISFVFKSWQIDILLFGLMVTLIILDTLLGVARAKKEKKFDRKVLTEKIIGKVVGYLLFLVSLWIFIMMLFIINIKDGKPFIDDYWLNLPMMTALLFFSAVEYLSISDKIKDLYGIKLPTAWQDKIEDFVEKGDIDEIKDLGK